jgi:nicotinate (nicotinamide) nucleotide adenylyltransferase
MDKDANKLAVKAIFGGTFDPPHLGHLLPLQEIADVAQLSAIALLPANIPVFKKDVTLARHRIAMTKLLCELDNRLSVDLTEFAREDTSYTIDTLINLKQQNPQQPIIFIIGLDSLLTIHLWERWRQLFDYCHILVMQRSTTTSIKREMPNFTPLITNMAPNLYNFYTSTQGFDTIVGPKIDKQARLLLLTKLAQAENDTQCINHDAFKDIIQKSATGRLWFIKNELLPLSSTYIRHQIKAGQNIEKCVPPSVNDYINRHQLYIK